MGWRCTLIYCFVLVGTTTGLFEFLSFSIASSVGALVTTLM
jgi:hypothetical protein